MPIPFVVQALPYIGAGLGALKNLFGGGSDSRDDARDQAQGVQELLRALPQVQQMLDLQVRQAQRNDPLHEALVQMSMNLLPRSAMSPLPGRQPAYGSQYRMPAFNARQPNPGAQFTGTRAIPRPDKPLEY